jgi:hypothetical protein
LKNLTVESTSIPGVANSQKFDVDTEKGWNGLVNLVRRQLQRGAAITIETDTESHRVVGCSPSTKGFIVEGRPRKATVPASGIRMMGIVGQSSGG